MTNPNHTDTSRSGDLVKECRLDAKAFRENTVYDSDGDPIRLIANADRLDQYADRIEALEAENERLREALEPFTFREDGDDEAVSIQHPSIIVRCEVTYGDIQLARAALEAHHD